MTETPVPPTRRAEAALLGAAFFYGTTFVIVQDAVDRVGPNAFLATRFALATLVLAPFALRRQRARTPLLGRDSLAAAVTMAAGFALQTVGLQYTTPSRSAFLTYLLVVFVPVIAALTIRRLPTARVVGSIAAAAVGLALLTDVGSGGFGRGELLTVGCAVGFAANVVVVSAVIDRHDAVLLTFGQLAWMSLLFLVPGAIEGFELDAASLGAAAFTGVFASAAAFGLQNWGQRGVGPSRAALLLVTEPVFAAAIDAWRGEALGPLAAVGAAVIVVAVLVAETDPRAVRVGPPP